MRSVSSGSEVELVAILAALTAASSLAIDFLLPALPGIGHALGVSGNRLQDLVSAFVVASGVGALFAGPLADRFGRRRVLLGACLLFAAAAAACGLAQDFGTLLALRTIQGLAGAAMMVLPMSVIRDRFAGDRMARVMSLVVVTFMVVPLLAPSLGLFAYALVGWRWLFALLGTAALLLVAWVWLRLPETLAPERRRPIGVPALLSGWAEILRSRAPISYIAGQTILMGATYAYVFSGQQIVGQHFGRPALFGVVFAAVSLGMAASSLTNSWLVVRLGTRRVATAAARLFVAIGLVQLLLSLAAPGSLAAFVAVLMASQAAIGFTSTNLGALAMQDLGHLAGAASGLIGAGRMLLGGIVGAAIGQAYDGTTRPLAIGYLLCGIAVLGCLARARSAAPLTVDRTGTA